MNERRRVRHGRLQLALLAVVVLGLLWVQGPRLLDSYAVDEDSRSAYWMSKFSDPELFPSDPTSGYTDTTIRFLGRDVPFYPYSFGYGFLYYAASFFVSPIMFSTSG